jgi:RNA polymerase sigma-70 factor (ECF subfamily)
MVLRAGESGPGSAAALETLCQSYWAPIYAFVRRQGQDAHAAQDLTQEFFTRLIEGNRLSAADPNRGRFRSFLLASLKNFLTNEWRRSQSQKRGGGCTLFSLNDTDNEERMLDAFHADTPERIFERRWAESVIARVNSRLRREYEAAGWAERFEALKIYLLDDFDPPSYADTAFRLGLTEGAVKSAIFKLRKRYGEMFRAEIADTVSDPAEVDEEIDYLLRALGH